MIHYKIIKTYTTAWGNSEHYIYKLYAIIKLSLTYFECWSGVWEKMNHFPHFLKKNLS